MQIEPGQLIRYNHGHKQYYVIIDVEVHGTSLYNIKTGLFLTHITTEWILHNFLFL